MRYLGVKIDSKLNWKSHVNVIATKLNRANAMLYKVRGFVNPNILKSIYYGLTVCYCHATYPFQSEFTLYSCLNVKDLLAQSSCKI